MSTYAAVRARGVLARADLLEALVQQDLDWFALPHPGAEQSGFRRIAPSVTPLPVEPVHWLDPFQFPAKERLETSKRAPLQVPEFWTVTEHQQQNAEGDAAIPKPEFDIDALPPWTPPDPDVAEKQAQAWRRAGLQSWPRLRNALRNALQPSAFRAPLDWPELIRRVASAQAPQHLPRLRRARWPANLVLGLDDSASIWPFAEERNQLHQRLQRAVGRALDARWLSPQIGVYRPCNPPRKADSRKGLYRAPQAGRRWRPLFGGTQVLISDLAGAPDASTPDLARAVALRRWLKTLAHGGTRTLVLTPHRASASQLPAGVQTLSFSGKPMRAALAATEPPQLNTLIALVAGFGFGTASLLRALAPLLAKGDAAIALAWAAWNHPHLQREGGDCVVCTDQQSHYEGVFAALAPALLIAAWQRALCVRAVAGDEALLHLLNARCLTLASVLAEDLALAGTRAQQYFAQTLPAQLAGPESRNVEQRAYRLIHAAHPSVRIAYASALRQLQAQACRSRLAEGADITTYPELGRPGAPASSYEVRSWQLVQCAQHLLLRRESHPGQGFCLARLAAPAGALVQLNSGAFRKYLNTVEAERAELVLADLSALTQPLQLRLGANQLNIERVPRPSWAGSWGRDQEGLWVKTPKLGVHSARFRPVPGNPAATLFLPSEGEQRDEFTGLCMGLDRYGAFVDISVKKVTQRLRWIEPGEFWMGSLETEEGRYTDEGPRHRVTLTQGYWLADTACTQAFWLAVVGGSNPSLFTGDTENPVEQVNWDDIRQQFLPALQSLLGRAVRVELPSEAQWEYACRAGAETAYNVGDQIEKTMANFDGRETVPVAHFPPNSWGLMQMHGNVWEWCRDGMRIYTNEAVVDPEGPSDSRRALRGGSWFSEARIVRSASRYARTPVRRINDLGFRFAVRSMSSVQLERPKGARRRDGDAL